MMRAIILFFLFFQGLSEVFPQQSIGFPLLLGRAQLYDRSFDLIEIKKNDAVRVKYFLSPTSNEPSVYNDFLKWSKNRKLLFMCNASYVNEMMDPVGLAIQNGVCINRQVLSSLSAVAISDLNGAFSISNLNNVLLPTSGTTVHQPFNLLDTYSKVKFINELTRLNCTAFQTHLLLQDNSIVIGNDSGGDLDNMKRERRILALCEMIDGSTSHFFINVDFPYTLFDVTSEFKSVLLSKVGVAKINYMINLDTGFRDFIRVYEENGSFKHEISGGKDISGALNLLVYYMDN